MFGSGSNPQMSQLLAMMMQNGGGQNPFSSPMGGQAPQANMSPQIPIAAKSPATSPIQQPQQQQQQGVPGGGLGAAVNTGENVSKLYNMGNKAYNGVDNMINGSQQPVGNAPQLGNIFSGASNVAGQQNAQQFMGGMNGQAPSTFGSTAPNYTGYGMAGPSTGGTYGGQQGANAAFMGGGQAGQAGASQAGMYGSVGANGTAAAPGAGFFGGMSAGGAPGVGSGVAAQGLSTPGAMGAGSGGTASMFGGAGATGAEAAGGAAAESSPSWLSSLWALL